MGAGRVSHGAEDGLGRGAGSTLVGPCRPSAAPCGSLRLRADLRAPMAPPLGAEVLRGPLWAPCGPVPGRRAPTWASPWPVPGRAQPVAQP